MSNDEGLARIQVHPIDAESCLVEYSSRDDGFSPEFRFQAEVAADVAKRAGEGWRLLSLSVYPLRNGGTVGSVFSQGGGNYATVLGATALLRRTPRANESERGLPLDGAAGYP